MMLTPTLGLVHCFSCFGFSGLKTEELAKAFPQGPPGSPWHGELLSRDPTPFVQLGPSPHSPTRLLLVYPFPFHLLLYIYLFLRQ